MKKLPVSKKYARTLRPRRADDPKLVIDLTDIMPMPLSEFLGLCSDFLDIADGIEAIEVSYWQGVFWHRTSALAGVPRDIETDHHRHGTVTIRVRPPEEPLL